ncbi:MAG TPA: PAS domain S-box protein [Candidatus Acidoferrum sp.]
MAQALDSYFGLILKTPFEQRWALDVLYYAWPASLVIGLSLRSQGDEKNWIWERILDFLQAGILLAMLYLYFSGTPLRPRGPGVWTLSLATDGLIAIAFFARAALSGRDPSRKLFQRIGYFRLAAAFTDLYFVIGFSDSIRNNWFDPVWSAQWLFAIYAATAWEGNAEPKVEKGRLLRVQQTPAGQFLLPTFPLLVVVLAAGVAKGLFALAAIAVLLSLSISFGHLMLGRRRERERIEERNRAIEKLEASEERYRTLFEGSPVGIAVLNDKGREVACNNAYRELVGIREGEELTFDLLMSLTSPERQETDRAIFEEIGSGARPGARREKQYHRRDGKSVWADLSLFGQQNSSRDCRLVTGMAIDITEKKQLEQQLRQAQKIETIGRLAGGVAHDFNNLLTVIRGYCDVLMEDQTSSASVLGRLEHISRAADRAASLTHQLLAFSRRQVLQPKILQLNDLVLECAKMLHRLIGEDVEMQIFGTSGLGRKGGPRTDRASNFESGSKRSRRNAQWWNTDNRDHECGVDA